MVARSESPRSMLGAAATAFSLCTDQQCNTAGSSCFGHIWLPQGWQRHLLTAASILVGESSSVHPWGGSGACPPTFGHAFLYLVSQVCRERELRKEGREVPSRVRLREGPIGVRITLGQPTIAYFLVVPPVPLRLFGLFQFSFCCVYAV